MPRKPHAISTEYPYHVTVRTNNKDWFELSMDQMWEIFSSHLFLTRHAFNLRIHAFVLMSNHFHLLVTTPDGNLSEAMQFFIGHVSKEISRQQQRINHNFKQRYYRSLLTSETSVAAVYKYIYQNPLRAGISRKAHHYKYSTLGEVLGLRKGIIPINDNILFDHGDWMKTLNWISEDSEVAVTESIRKGLKKREFEFIRDRSTRSEVIPDLP